MTTAGGDNVYLQMSRLVSGSTSAPRPRPPRRRTMRPAAPPTRSRTRRAGGGADGVAHWVYLEEESEFNDLVSTEFNLTAELQPMRRAIGGRVASRANGGEPRAAAR